MNTILHLGGRFDRVRTTVNLASDPITRPWTIISTEYAPAEIARLFAEAKVPGLITFHYWAWDTLTNFTLTRKLIRSRGTKHLFVVTDQYHMRRAMVIAKIVYAFTGVTVHAATHKTAEPGRVEPLFQVIKDGARAVVWKLFKLTLYDPFIKRKRMPEIGRLAKEAAALQTVRFGTEDPFKAPLDNPNMT
jgi:hypothetical protein